jgi:hypothetical protein
MDPLRWLRHWFHAPASRAFPPQAMQRIRDAIAAGPCKGGNARNCGPATLPLPGLQPRCGKIRSPSPIEPAMPLLSVPPPTTRARPGRAHAAAGA